MRHHLKTSTGGCGMVQQMIHLHHRKTTFALKTPHVVFLSFFFGRSIDAALESQWNILSNIFWLRDLDIWLITLTYELELDILLLDLHTKIHVRMSVRSAVRVVTDTHTDRRYQNYYTRHVTDVGCNFDNYSMLANIDLTIAEWKSWVNCRVGSFFTPTNRRSCLLCKKCAEICSTDKKNISHLCAEGSKKDPTLLE